MRITMREVAERAGVSKATVSYVLNGRDEMMRIPDETKQRILLAVRELDYHPNAIARSLAHSSTHTIAVVMQFPSLFAGWSGFTNELMHGVTDAAVIEGYDVLLQTRNPLASWQNTHSSMVQAEVANLTDGRVDGALLLRDKNDPLPQLLQERGLPLVLMFTHTEDDHTWYVDCDNFIGGKIATEHLISLGHTRIAHLTGPPHSVAAQDRKRGYHQALANAGIQDRATFVLEVRGPDASFGEIADLFAQPASQRPTALFAWSDDVAIQAMQALRKQGLSVPDDVAIVGFDSTALCDHTDPPLTSVRQPVYDMAARSLRLLTAKLRNESPEQTQFRVVPELVVRRSCGARSIRPSAAIVAVERRQEEGHAAPGKQA